MKDLEMKDLEKMTKTELLDELVTYSPGFSPSDRSWLKALVISELVELVKGCRKAVAEGKEVR